jgi:hypothetical protein
MKNIILSLLVALSATTGAWAQIAVSGSGNSRTFTMPAYDVEVSTELWYKLEEDADNSSALKAKTDVFLERTLQTGGWNTFSVPFDINPIPTGWTVKKLSTSDFNTTTKVLTLNFTDETTKIAAGVPYLISVESAYDFTADGHEFSGVTQNYTANTTSTTYADFVPAMDRLNLTASQDILFVTGGNKLTYPTSTGYMKGFRAYFLLKGAAASAGAREFKMDFGNGETTGVADVRGKMADGRSEYYDLQGRKVAQPTQRGIYIQNGKKVIIK